MPQLPPMHVKSHVAPFSQVHAPPEHSALQVLFSEHTAGQLPEVQSSVQPAQSFGQLQRFPAQESLQHCPTPHPLQPIAQAIPELDDARDEEAATPLPTPLEAATL